jgi:transposase
MSNEKFEREILKRLDAIIKISTLGMMKENTQTERIDLLNSVGFSPKEISEILNTSSNTVSVVLNKLKKKKNKEERNDKQRSNEGMAGKEENESSKTLSSDRTEAEPI